MNTQSKKVLLPPTVLPPALTAETNRFRKQYTNRPSGLKEPSVSKWIENRRVLPASTPFPGYWRNSRTPYLVEIMDCLSPVSLVQYVGFMKGVQIGATSAAENALAYWIGECPAEILFVSATDDLLERWATKRLEPLLDSCGLRGLIHATTNVPGSRRTGDKLRSKQFVGGALDMASAQSAPGLRSESKRVLFRDEIDGAPPQLKTGEGNWIDVSFARTAAWGPRKKIFDFSTPTTEAESLIKTAYENGDQRQFEVPCPFCGTYQVLKWGTAKTVYGIKAERVDGVLRDVYYCCNHCYGKIRNHHKTQMLAAGNWVPTAQSISPTYRSYQLSSLYSPVGMLSWHEMQELFDKAQLESDGMRSFRTLYLGLPFRESGSRPKLEKVIELRGGYRSGVVPDKVLFLTIGVDVQTGSETDSLHPPRLELEVCGHGLGYRTWSILYRRFEGGVKTTNGKAWSDFSEWATETGLVFRRKDGTPFSPVLIFIDSGDGNVTDVVYSFCSQWSGTFPSKGFSALRKRKDEKEDEIGPAHFRRYRAVKLGQDSALYEISTTFYKGHIYNNLKIDRQDIGPQKPGFCDFPIDYGESYFRMLTAEEKRRDGSFYCPSGRRNEALDCRVMNLCAGDVFLDSEVIRLRDAYRAKKASPEKLALINRRFALDLLAKNLGIS